MAGDNRVLGERINRRGLLWGGLVAGGTAVGAGAAIAQSSHAGHQGYATASDGAPVAEHGAHGDMMSVGEVDYGRNGFDPHKLLTDWEDDIARK